MNRIQVALQDEHSERIVEIDQPADVIHVDGVAWRRAGWFEVGTVQQPCGALPQPGRQIPRYVR